MPIFGRTEDRTLSAGPEEPRIEASEVRELSHQPARVVQQPLNVVGGHLAEQPLEFEHGRPKVAVGTTERGLHGPVAGKTTGRAGLLASSQWHHAWP